jgi:hypothetical protein
VALTALLTAAALLVHQPPLIVGMCIGSGLNSVAILAALWVMPALPVLPAVEAGAGRRAVPLTSQVGVG